VLTRTERKPVAASGTTRRASWQATVDPEAPAKAKSNGESHPTASDGDAPADENRAVAPDDEPRNRGPELDNGSTTPSNSRPRAKTTWRAVKMVPNDQTDTRPDN
jgi:hypothetical protein